MADARELVNWIRGNISKLRRENFPISQEIYLIKQTEGWAKELHANQLVKDLENYRIFYLEEYQALKGKGTLNPAKLDAERKRVLVVALEHLAEISA
jgi:hypothetical protein